MRINLLLDFTLVHHHHGDMSPRTDWPLGEALRQRRIAAGLSVKAAARRTNGAISDGRWYQLESGVQKIRGQTIPISTTAATVAAVAKAVEWDITDALEVAGFDPRDYQPPKHDDYLSTVHIDVLLGEIRRRVVSDEPQGWNPPDAWLPDQDPRVSGAEDRDQGRQLRAR